jgi:hypothetical protein
VFYLTITPNHAQGPYGRSDGRARLQLTTDHMKASEPAAAATRTRLAPGDSVEEVRAAMERLEEDGPVLWWTADQDPASLHAHL